MTSYQFRKSHYGDKMILQQSDLHNGISYTGKMTSLYCIRAPGICNKCDLCLGRFSIKMLSSQYARISIIKMSLTTVLFLYWEESGKKVFILKQGTGSRFTNDFLPAIQIRWKLCLAVIPLLAIRSQQIFAHATTAQLSCHVQNFVAITISEWRWE